jgi:hypothetical protein
MMSTDLEHALTEKASMHPDEAPDPWDTPSMVRLVTLLCWVTVGGLVAVDDLAAVPGALAAFAVAGYVVRR